MSRTPFWWLNVPFAGAAGTGSWAASFVEGIDPPVGVGVAAVVGHRLLVIDAAVIEHPVIADAAGQAAIDSNAGVVRAAADAGRGPRLILDQAADLPAAEHLA